SVIVRINDRGPYIRGRIIDLSSSMFKKIADPKVGVIDVQVTVIDKAN
ncbi:MAG: septal ring lytic transglycosylase RlpA family protein, partial [Pseudoalteromonas nigrifaciens]